MFVFAGQLHCHDWKNIRGENPNTSTFSYTQDNASIIAGNDLTISAGTINNTYGNLIAGHNIVVGGVSTSAGSTTAAQTLTNTSGNILAGNDIALNVSGAITNALPPPVQVHQNYGSVEKYSGCMTAGGYKESYCEAYVDQQSGDSSVISAGNTLSIQAGSLTNVGSLITAGVNATINVAGPIVNQAQTLNAYWHSHWVQETGMFSPDKRHEVWGCGSAAECTALYGSAYTKVGGPIDPPTPVGNIAATIEAPNLSITSSGKIVNVGNVVGQSVSLTGTNLSNGITKSNTYTPVVGNPPQVISLAPASGGLNLSIPATLGGNTSVQAHQALGRSSNQSSGPTYVLDGTGTNLDRVTPQVLLSSLPANLQPSTALFYYDPQAEDAALQTAALKQTGQATFVNGLSSDSQQQLSVTDQEKLVLYANAKAFAEANDIQLGQALTQQQIGELTQPMLWYVEQTVPEPGCTATGTLSCPTITALMPQVYLPANMSALSADGNIVASDSIKLNFGSKDTGGSILNTGTIASGGSLTVNTGALTNQQNQVDVGQIWTNVSGGYLETTGTVAQPGGFMTAAVGQMSLNVSQLHQIGGLLQEVNPDGSTNNAATQQLLGQVLQQLGGNFTQTTVSDNLHTNFVAAGGFGAMQLLAMAAAVAIALMAQPEISTMIGSMAGSVAGSGTMFAAAATSGAAIGTGAGLGNIALSAGLAALASSGASQLIGTGHLDFGSMLQSAGVAAVTAGLLNGITYTSANGLGFEMASSTNSLASLVAPTAAGGLAHATAGFTLSQLPSQLAGIAGESLVQAGVQTAIGGGSFLDALKVDAISDLAAVGASEIGDITKPLTLGNIALHGALGCLASAADGNGCAGGAIGGAASALASPLLLGAVDPNHDPLTTGQTAALGAFATLAGGLPAGLAGANAQAGAQAGQNVALNNDAQHWVLPGSQAQAGLPGQQDSSTSGSTLIANPFGNAGAAACAGGLQQCNMQVFQAAMQAQGANADQALSSMQTMALYGGPLAGVAMLGPEALTAAGLAGAYDYAGDAYSYATGLSKDTPNFTKSYITGIVGGLTYPFAIGDEAIASMGTAGKIAANGYNALVAGTGAFGAAAVTHQDNPDLSGGLAAGLAAAGSWAKSAMPGSLGNFANQLIQGIAGPLQSYIQKQQSKSGN